MFPELPHDCWFAAFEDIYDVAWKGACHGWVDEVGWGGWGWGAYLGYLEHCTVLAVTRYVAKSVFQDAEWGHPGHHVHVTPYAAVPGIQCSPPSVDRWV